MADGVPSDHHDVEHLVIEAAASCALLLALILGPIPFLRWKDTRR